MGLGGGNGAGDTFWGLRKGTELWGIPEVWEGLGTGISAGDNPVPFVPPSRGVAGGDRDRP